MIINSNIDVRRSLFERNKALFGGAIRYKGSIPKFLVNALPSDLWKQLD